MGKDPSCLQCSQKKKKKANRIKTIASSVAYGQLRTAPCPLDWIGWGKGRRSVGECHEGTAKAERLPRHHLLGKSQRLRWAWALWCSGIPGASMVKVSASLYSPVEYLGWGCGLSCTRTLVGSRLPSEAAFCAPSAPDKPLRGSFALLFMTLLMELVSPASLGS